MNVNLELKTSLNTDTFAQGIVPFGENAENLINTGIERLGGITNLYEKEATYTLPGERYYTDDGKEIALTDSTVADYQVLTLDGVSVAQVSEYGVEKTTILDACDDAFLETDSYTTVTLRGGVITLTEYDFDNVVLHTRDITFTNLTAVLQFYTSLSFVQYQNQTYADSQEFALRLGDQLIILKESTPTQEISLTFGNVNALGGGVVYSMAVYNNILVVAGYNGRVASFDGSVWVSYNSSSGLCNNGSVTGSEDIYAMSVYGSLLVVAGKLGRVGSWDGATWTNYNSTSGLCNDGTVIGVFSITVMAVYGTALVVGGVTTYIGSWNGTAWTNYNAGSGLCNAGTVLGSTTILAMVVYNTFLVVAGGSGRIGSWNGSAWTNYNAGSGLCNNGTVIGAGAVWTMAVYGTQLAVAGETGRVGSWSGSAWTNYNAGAGLCNDGTVIGTERIYTSIADGGLLIIAGNAGRLGSWNGTTWTNYNAGAGLCNNGAVVGVKPIKYSLVYKGSFVLSNDAGTVNAIYPNGTFVSLYTEGATNKARLFYGINSISYLYCYRYEYGLYHVNVVNNNLNQAFTLNDTTKAILTLRCSFSLLQISGGYSRHIISASDISTSHIYDGTSIKASGLVGYTDFVTFSGSVVYPVNTIVVGNSLVQQSKASFGYSDFTYQTTASATNVYNYISQFQPTVNSLFQIIQGNTNTLIDGYGKLTNNLGLPSVKPFELRVGMIAGQSSFLSAALLDGIQSDTLGVLITNVGEFDDSYQPQIVDDDKIMYLSNGSLVIKKIGLAAVNKIQQISPTTYKINTISPLNILDTTTGLMHVGSCDYNNRMLFSSTAAPGLVTKVVSLFEGLFSNSIDTGDKLVTITPLTSANLQIIGARVPIVSTTVNDYAIDTYIDDEYAFSTLNDGSELVKPSKENLVYAETPIIPVSIGQSYSSGIISGNMVTIFLKPDYDGYSIGNDIAGTYTLFKLYGQTYLFDGSFIYAADIDATGIFSTKTKLAPAGGLRYIASSPTEITFLSDFDNSVYSFTGGRNLAKAKRFTSVGNILSGVYDVRENTLVLDTASTIIFIRDSLITLNIKKANQTAVKYYPTAEGVIITNNVNSWQYSYNALSGSTIVPLDLKTGYYGLDNHNNGILQSYTVTIYNESRSKVTIDTNIYTVQADYDKEQAARWVIMPKDYNSGGFARLRIIPKYKKMLGSSIRLSTNEKILIVSVQAEIDVGENATVAKNRTV